MLPASFAAVLPGGFVRLAAQGGPLLKKYRLLLIELYTQRRLIKNGKIFQFFLGELLCIHSGHLVFQ
jgi:hypothetical protein